ncbi:uncharacterized protein LOC114939217 [Nylanderia fulva]|uniref:uncharacterized protein LOC114939217 n=1 Tax=Nylanderia fulva TaxID=613905 RepID=UPI0010FAF515|nr:uncharacterized protein LOC114939217 [Nylanderia fulva]
MKQPIAARIIEFPLKLTMVNTYNIFAVLAVAFLASLSLSSAFVKEDFDTSKDFQNNFDPELQPFLREKREENAYYVNKPDPLELEELSESQTVHDRRAIAEETKDDRKTEEPKTSKDGEEDAKNDIFAYRSMQDLIQAFILADEQDIAMRLQQLQEIENATQIDSKKFSNLPKRQASAAAAAAASSNLVGGNLWDAVPLDDLDAHSCEVEAFDYGHGHSSGLVIHEFFCEIRKLWHYLLIIVRNLRAGLTLGPLIAEEVIVEGRGLLHFFLYRIPRLLFHIIRAPHHLLLLPDICRDAIPFPSIGRAIHRLLHVVFKVKHVIHELLWGHIRYVVGHFFRLHHLGLNLRDRLLQLRLTRLRYLHQFGTALPCETAASAGSAAATATATASVADGGAYVPDYHNSLAEILSCFRGIYGGYHASGIPHMIRTGVTSISTSTVYSRVTSYLSNIPAYWGSLRSCFYRIPSLVANYWPQQVATASAASAASSVSSAASASASVVETQPLVSAPLISAVPTIVSPVLSSSGAAAAAAATAAATAAASASPISSYRVTPQLYESAVPCTPLVSETIENTVSESSSSSVAVASPEVGVSGGVASASAAASASASDGGLVSSPYRYGGPISSNGLLANRYGGLDVNLGGRIPLYRQRIRPVILPSYASPSSASAATAAASAASGSAAAASSASSLSSGGLNFILPREHVVGAIGHDYLTPGDLIAVTLRNKAILVGRVLDATSPISFSFLRPKLRASLFRHGGRVWNLFPRDFRDPECIRKFNNPLLLRYTL